MTEVVGTISSCADKTVSLEGEDMKSIEPRLQEIEDSRYIVRLGTFRMGEVVENDGKWFYFGRIGISRIGYSTKEEAANELIAITTRRLKKPSDYPRIHFRLSQERIEWFRDYAKRGGKSMSSIIKEYIEELYQQDHSGA